MKVFSFDKVAEYPCLVDLVTFFYENLYTEKRIDFTENGTDGFISGLLHSVKMWCQAEWCKVMMGGDLATRPFEGKHE